MGNTPTSKNSAETSNPNAPVNSNEIELADVGESTSTSMHYTFTKAAGDDMENSHPNTNNEGEFDVKGARGRALTFSPAIPNNSPTVLTFSNIIVSTKGKKPKVLLNNISGNITGGFWAIMGSSGGGKTTLLSTLSLRLDTNYMNIEGHFRLNGKEYDRSVLKAMSAYVMQDDLLHAELTVEETLMYAARLRMPSSVTKLEREERIQYLLTLLGISHTRKVIIGNTRKKGISGGERKRVSVAIELLNHPKLLFLDEPTSGLDSSTAFTVCTALKNLTIQGECTVICTIHQPQPKIFDLFDYLVLMKQGQIFYQGAANKVSNYVKSLGFECPVEMSIADHILEVISPTHEYHEMINDANQKLMVPVNLSLGADKGHFFNSANRARTWLQQFTILFQRNLQQYLRNSDIIFMNFVVTVLIAIFIGRGLWYQIGTGQDSIPLRVPSLFFTCITQGILGSLQAINSFPSERAIMLRERQAGTYQVSAYFMAKTAVDMLSQSWPPMLFSCIVYFMIGYQKKATKFFYYMLFMTLDALAATSLATCVTCFCVSVELTSVVLSLFFEIARLFGGFFASPLQVKDIPNWKFADALSYIKYAFMGLVLNELRGLELECPTGTTCTYTDGNDIIYASGYEEYSISFCIGILIVLIVGWRFLAYLGLRYIKT
jgi:ATP-binding cassette, subfamily G (WHITE), member 2